MLLHQLVHHPPGSRSALPRPAFAARTIEDAAERPTSRLPAMAPRDRQCATAPPVPVAGPRSDASRTCPGAPQLLTEHHRGHTDQRAEETVQPDEHGRRAARQTSERRRVHEPRPAVSRQRGALKYASPGSNPCAVIVRRFVVLLWPPRGPHMCATLLTGRVAPGRRRRQLPADSDSILEGVHADANTRRRMRPTWNSITGSRPCARRRGLSSTMTSPTPPSPTSTKSCGSRCAASSSASWHPTRSGGRRSTGSPTRPSRKLAAQGLLGLKYPEEYGGQGGDYLHEAVLCEEMARIGSGGTAAGLGAHINIATPPIWKFGTEEQKQRYLVPAIAGRADRRARHHRAGRRLGRRRDHHARRARRRRLGGERREDLHHQRRPRALHRHRRQDHPVEGGHHGISFLIVDRGEGVTSSALQKLGWHASDTATIAFQDVFVPEENLLGPLNEGFKLIMANFQWERLAMALGAVGAMKLAWERTAEFARERHDVRAPARPGHQTIRHKLADLATSVYTCRCVTYDALRRFVAGEEPMREVTMAKLLTQRASLRADGRVPADPRRRRLHARVLGRARRPRRPPRPDRRRQRRDHARDPRSRARL